LFSSYFFVFIFFQRKMSLDEKLPKSLPEEEVKQKEYYPALKTGHNGISLLPYPSDNPHDPLVRISAWFVESITDFQELAITQETHNSRCNLLGNFLRLLGLFGWPASSGSSITVIQGHHNTDGLSGPKFFVLILVTELTVSRTRRAQQAWPVEDSSFSLFLA
jgi:hypothetical protein